MVDSVRTMSHGDLADMGFFEHFAIVIAPAGGDITEAISFACSAYEEHHELPRHTLYESVSQTVDRWYTGCEVEPDELRQILADYVACAEKLISQAEGQPKHMPLQRYLTHIQAGLERARAYAVRDEPYILLRNGDEPGLLGKIRCSVSTLTAAA